MPQNEAADIDPLAGGSFSRLLFSDVEVEDAVTLVGLDHHLRHHPDNTSGGGASHFTFSADQKPPKMLCFGADYVNSNINGVSVVSLTPQNSTTTTTDDNNNSSSPSSTTNSTTTSLSSNSTMKRKMGCDYYQPVVLPSSLTTTGGTPAPVTSTRRSYKKMRAENTPPASHAKVVKKEKLGERIAALQQLVSPYGKTDTASVLHEAMGYIKFLQEQVQVLCSPYLQRLPSTHVGGKDDGGGERKKDLRSRGLCLVAVECTLHVAESNGADLWSPATAMVNHHDSSSALR